MRPSTPTSNPMVAPTTIVAATLMNSGQCNAFRSQHRASKNMNLSPKTAFKLHTWVVVKIMVPLWVP